MNVILKRIVGRKVARFECGKVCRFEDEPQKERADGERGGRVGERRGFEDPPVQR
jgi:hypothetical protein